MKKKAAPRRSNVTTASYDPDTRALDVTFHNGRTYRYHDVPEHHGNGMVAAESRGSYLHKHIAKHFDFSEQKPEVGPLHVSHQKRKGDT